MVGGVLNLLSVGEEGLILVGNPQKTFFKKVFQSYTNFGQQKFRINPEGTTRLNHNSTTTYTFNIPRHGDLLLDTYFSLTLPNIWSPILSNLPLYPICSSCRTLIGSSIDSVTVSNDTFNTICGGATPCAGSDNFCWHCQSQKCNTCYTFNTSKVTDANRDSQASYSFPYEFKWIKNIGIQMINKISVYANETLLQEFSGQYLSNMIARDFSSDKKELIDRMVGNVSELNDPANYLNRNGNYPNAAYYGSLLEDTKTNGNGNGNGNNINNNLITNNNLSDIFSPEFLEMIQIQQTRQQSDIFSNQNVMLYGLEPSIRGRQLFVPINIWSTLSSKTATPLIAMQYTNLKIEIEIKPVNDLWVVRNVLGVQNQLDMQVKDTLAEVRINTLDVSGAGMSNTDIDKVLNCQACNNNESCDTIRTVLEPQYIKPDCQYEAYQMNLFLKEPPNKMCPVTHVLGLNQPACMQMMTSKEAGTIQIPFLSEQTKVYYGIGSEQLNESPADLLNFFADVHLIGNYGFLDEEERRDYAENCKSILFKEVHEHDIYNIVGNRTLKIETGGLVVSWMWYFQRSDVNLRNEWNNYTNWPYQGLSAVPKSDIYQDIVNDICEPGCPIDGTLQQLYWTTTYYIRDLEDIMINWGLYFDKTVREENRDSVIWKYAELYTKSNSSGNQGVYYYNFCLNTDPFVYQPSGAINMSKFNNVFWDITVLFPDRKGSYELITAGGDIIAKEDQTFSISVTCNNNLVHGMPNYEDISVTTNKQYTDQYMYTYTLHIMEERYNIIHIENGIAGLVFVR